MRARLQRNAHGELLVEFGSEDPGICGHPEKFVVPACRYQTRLISIHAYLDLMGILHAPHEVERIPPQPELDHVFSVQRSIMVHQDTAARSERQAFDVLIL